MNAKHIPLTPKDFGLAPNELKELVTGAQTFLPPEPDPQDGEKLIPIVDVPKDQHTS